MNVHTVVLVIKQFFAFIGYQCYRVQIEPFGIKGKRVSWVKVRRERNGCPAI